MKKRYTGSCHCGAVRFETEVDLAEGTYRCNCSICSRTRFWPVIAKPEDFRLLAGEDVLVEYRFNTRNNLHLFCRHCGVRAFGIGQRPDTGQRIYGVNIGCLENVDDAELAAAPVIHVDGRNDSPHPPSETRHL